MENFNRLLKKLEDRAFNLVVVGGGYVGLPVAYEFAKRGIDTTVLEVDSRKVEALNRGESYIEDIPSHELKPLVESGKLSATTDRSIHRSADVVVITVPTPLDAEGNPDLSYVKAAIEGVREHLHPGMLISLESTTYPGTTDEMAELLEETGMRLGRDFFMGHSPERINPGDPVWKFHNTPKVVGGLDRLSTELMTRFYSIAVEKVVPVSTARAAELTKLLENTFRAVNIALVNEFAMISHKLNVDIWEVIEAAGTKPFGFMKFYPGPGVGGHCIPIDPLYLLWKVRRLGIDAEFIALADRINKSMPDFVVSLLEEALRSEGRELRDERILVLGVAYKKNISDTRESPAYRIVELLRRRGAQVKYHDPHVPRFMDMRSESLKSALGWTDTVVIITDHDAIDWGTVADRASIIVDSRNALRKRGIKPKGRLVVL
ncbi:MAG: nucleotide sugar dehydrogenase [Thermotogae bacterium]|nr:nucleotide sugar dehydrogenase [Thermotogota bacterium]